MGLGQSAGEVREMPPATQSALYRSLEALPEGLTGEILNGQIHAQSRPSLPHVMTGFMLGATLLDPFQKDIGGPDGWWIIIEPEVHFVQDIEVTVPDLAGWRHERISHLPKGHRIEIVPDWVCEILSPYTASRGREVKMPLYAHYGVQYAWLIDPTKRMLETYRLAADAWIETGRFADANQVAVLPFEAVSLDLEALWLPQDEQLSG